MEQLYYLMGATAVSLILAFVFIRALKKPLVDKELSDEEIFTRIVSDGGDSAWWFEEQKKKFPGRKFNFSGKIFARKQINGVNFSGCHLKDAVFAYAHLSECIFDDADVETADFGVAHLINCSFRKANLKHANFASAFISGTDFGFANVCGANFEDVSGYELNFFEVERDGDTRGFEEAKRLKLATMV